MKITLHHLPCFFNVSNERVQSHPDKSYNSAYPEIYWKINHCNNLVLKQKDNNGNRDSNLLVIKSLDFKNLLEVTNSFTVW